MTDIQEAILYVRAAVDALRAEEPWPMKGARARLRCTDALTVLRRIQARQAKGGE